MSGFLRRLFRRPNKTQDRDRRLETLLRNNGKNLGAVLFSLTDSNDVDMVTHILNLGSREINSEDLTEAFRMAIERGHLNIAERILVSERKLDSKKLQEAYSIAEERADFERKGFGGRTNTGYARIQNEITKKLQKRPTRKTTPELEDPQPLRTKGMTEQNAGDPEPHEANLGRLNPKAARRLPRRRTNSRSVG